MNKQDLQSLLTEYDQKRNRAIADAESRKVKLYEEIPGLEKLDNDITSTSIFAIKSVLTQRDPSAPKHLKEKLSILKEK